MLPNTFIMLLAGAVLAVESAPTSATNQPAKEAAIVNARANEVPNPFGAAGEQGTVYVIERSNADEGFSESLLYEYDIKSPGEGGSLEGVENLARIGWTDTTLIVLHDRTSEDRNPDDKKVALRDLIMGAWVHEAGKSPADLKAIYFIGAQQTSASIQSAAEEAYHKVYPDGAQFEESWNSESQLELTKDDLDSKKEAFDKMNNGDESAGGNNIASDVKKILGYYYDSREIWRWVISRRVDTVGMSTSVEVHF